MIGAALGTSDGCVIKLRVGRFDVCLLGGFVISRVGFVGEALLGL